MYSTDNRPQQGFGFNFRCFFDIRIAVRPLILEGQPKGVDGYPAGAARYLYLQKSCLGGHITGQTFGVSTVGKPRLNLRSLESTNEEAWKRLVHAVWRHNFTIASQNEKRV